MVLAKFMVRKKIIATSKTSPAAKLKCERVPEGQLPPGFLAIDLAHALGLTMDGSGFGLGWAVTTDVVATTQPGSVGTFSWGGMASTFFWIDPVEDLIAIQMTQLMPSGAYPIRPQLQQLVYAAIEE